LRERWIGILKAIKFYITRIQSKIINIGASQNYLGVPAS